MHGIETMAHLDSTRSDLKHRYWQRLRQVLFAAGCHDDRHADEQRSLGSPLDGLDLSRVVLLSWP